MAAVERNSDGSYDAVDSGGFGKDYHGQDAFGGRIGGTSIGGSHFGGFEEGHVGLDKDNTGHYEKLSSEALAQTESMPKSAFEADNSNESEEEEANSGMRDSLRDLNSESSEENSKVGSTMDTSFQIGDVNEDLEKARQKAEDEKKSYDEFKELRKSVENSVNSLEIPGAIKALNKIGLGHLYREDRWFPGLADLKGKLNEAADAYGIEHEDFNKIEVEDLSKAVSELLDKVDKQFSNKVQSAQNDYDTLKSSFTDKVEPKSTPKTSVPSEVMEEANKGPGKNMSNAKTSPSDYLTKANKDSTKEIPKEAPSRNDFGNHAANTLKGVADRVTTSVTAKALGLKSIEEFARENGYNPEKLSTMKAYMQYQNKQIMKAIPGIVKQIGSYVVERVKDAVDPSQLSERIRNTLARYNLASLIGAAILSMKSGAGLQASLDQALTMVDPEDQAAVSDYLEDVLNDEGTVNDLGNAFDDALAPEQNSDTAELDESIVSIGRKDNTDYSGFNAGLGTTSDADVKVFIARNVKADPILRRMISKMGK